MQFFIRYKTVILKMLVFAWRLILPPSQDLFLSLSFSKVSVYVLIYSDQYIDIVKCFPFTSNFNGSTEAADVTTFANVFCFLFSFERRITSLQIY